MASIYETAETFGGSCSSPKPVILSITVPEVKKLRQPTKHYVSLGIMGAADLSCLFYGVWTAGLVRIKRSLNTTPSGFSCICSSIITYVFVWLAVSKRKQLVSQFCCRSITSSLCFLSWLALNSPPGLPSLLINAGQKTTRCLNRLVHDQQWVFVLRNYQQMTTLLYSVLTLSLLIRCTRLLSSGPMEPIQSSTGDTACSLISWWVSQNGCCWIIGSVFSGDAAEMHAGSV